MDQPLFNGLVANQRVANSLALLGASVCMAVTCKSPPKVC